jgi:polyphosphate kinase 2
VTDRFEPEVIIDYLDDVDKDYLYELSCLQVELIRLQKHIMESRERLLILFEGRDTAGKGGAILRFAQHLNPRHYRVVALPKPTEAERGQWYFQRYLVHLPDPGQMAFFDRSWYNRAVVEPVMGFCTPEQYERFFEQVNTVERFLVEDGIRLIKFWYSIDQGEQLRRVHEREVNPLKSWKLSPVDRAAAYKWDAFTEYKQRMFERTSTEHCPWQIVRGNRKREARLESMRFVLSRFDYPEKGSTGQRVEPDPAVVTVRTR